MTSSRGEGPKGLSPRQVRCAWRLGAVSSGLVRGYVEKISGRCAGGGAATASLLRQVKLVVDENASEVLAGMHVGVALVDRVERVGAGHEFVEFELAGLVEGEHAQDVTAGRRSAEK